MFLLSDALSTGETKTTFASSGNILGNKLLLIASHKGLERMAEDKLTATGLEPTTT